MRRRRTSRESVEARIAERRDDVVLPREFRNLGGETRKALDAPHTDPAHHSRYRDFVVAMAYGERPRL
jgi:hypothetical protein